jgi:DNA-binding response OmpR family regulator
MLTARDAVGDRVKGLEAGADDYLVKPFAFRELVARTRALTRRNLDNRSVVLWVGDVCLDTEERLVTFRENAVDLSAKEFAILEYFLHNPRRILTREQIQEHVWNYDFASESNLVEVYVANIRRKLAAAGAPRTITTVRGAGYRYEAPRPLASF